MQTVTSRRTPHGRGARASAFTLVELLVVIGIIALLMSILLPTLGRVREQANMIKCGSNLRQFGQVLHIYASQNSGRVPLGYAGTKHAGYMVYQNNRFEVLGILYEGRLLTDGIEGFYCPSKLDSRWSYNTDQNPWPPPGPANALVRLGMTVRPCVNFQGANSGTAPVSSANDKDVYRGKFPQLTQMNGKAIAAEMFGEPMNNAAVNVDPTVLPHNKLINVCFADGSVAAIDSRTPDKNISGTTIQTLLKQLAAAGSGFASVQNSVYLNETVTPNTGIWAIFDSSR